MQTECLAHNELDQMAIYNVSYTIQCIMYDVLNIIHHCWLYLFELQTKSLLDHQITIGGLNQMTIYIPHPVGVARYIECVQFILTIL